jgi:hypothetical protein
MLIQLLKHKTKWRISSYIPHHHIKTLKNLAINLHGADMPYMLAVCVCVTLCDSIMSLKALMWLSLFLSNKKYTK